jgi:hypothetical protein
MTTLNDTTDAMVWAQEFCRIFSGRPVWSEALGTPASDLVVDEGTMVGWFANAMAVGEREGKQAVCPHDDMFNVTDDMASCRKCGILVDARET